MNTLKVLALALATQFGLAQTRGLIHKIPKNKNVIRTYNTGTPSGKLSQSDEFKIVVWNMYKGENKSWESDFKNLASDANLVIAQEMRLDGRMQNVFENFGDFEYATATSFYLYKKTRTGVATISDTVSTSKKFIRSKNKEPVVLTPKVVLITKYPLANGEELLVANIHAINFVSAQKLRRQVDTIAREIRNHKGPAIFAGDFNTWTNKKLSYVRTINKMVGLTEVEFTGKDDRMTFMGNKLDYIFYRGLTLNTAKVLGEIQGADHKPLVATFSLN